MFVILIITANLSIIQPTPSSRPSAEVRRIPHAVPGEFTEAIAPLVKAMHAKVDELSSEEQFRQGAVPTITRCAEALSMDWGDPAVNFEYQFMVLNSMRMAFEVAPKEEKEAAREAFRAGALSFHQSGGYQDVDAPENVRGARKLANKFFAECLVLAAGTEDVEVRSVLQEVSGRMELGVTALTPELIADNAARHGISSSEMSNLWAAEDQRFVERLQSVMGLATPPEQLAAMVEALTGDVSAAIEAVRLRAIDEELLQAAPWLLGDKYDSGVGPAAASDDPCLSGYRMASAAAMKKARTIGKNLHYLARRGTDEAARIEKITKAVLKGVGEDCLDQSLLATLLVTYRSVLSRPGATDRVVQSIDRGLQQTGAQRLEPAQVRVLWARAVGAMRTRASEACKGLVLSLLETEKDEQVRKALEKARSDLASSRRP